MRIKISIFINYFLFAILLNSVGTVILQSQRFFSLSTSATSIIEVVKDLSLAITSFFIASFIARIGYKKSMLIALTIIAIGCFLIPSIQTFLAIKILFAITGACFALTKVSVFGTIGLITQNEKQHISMMGFIESVFMLGILVGYFVFGNYIDDNNARSTSWFNAYYLLGSLSLVAFFLLLVSPLNEAAIQTKNQLAPSENNFSGMLKLILLPAVLSFTLCAFLYVLIEQSFMSWLPTYNNKALQLSSTISVQITSILAASIALGRFFAAALMKKLSWIKVLIGCLTGAAILILIALTLLNTSEQTQKGSWLQVPLIAYIIPLIGFFLAPIYPAINSVILTSLPKSKQGMMSGLIIVFSALGGSVGSLTMGYIFQTYGGRTAFYFSMIPMFILISSLLAFDKICRKKEENENKNLGKYSILGVQH